MSLLSWQHGAPVLALMVLFGAARAEPSTQVLEGAITVVADTLPEFKTDPWSTESQGNQISGVVRVMRQDARGWYWFGTQDGLARFDGERLVYFDIRDAHGRGVVVRAIAEDSDGDLWFGTSGGLTRYDGKHFTHYSERDGLVSDEVWSLLAGSDGTLWIGTLYGACTFDGASFAPLPLPEGERNRRRGVSSKTMVRWIAEDRAGRIWIAGECRVFRLDGSELETVEVLDGDPGVYVTMLLEDRSGDMWFGTDDRGLIRSDGQTSASFTAPHGLGGVEVNGLFEDSQGNIWFTVEGLGVCRYDGSALARFTEADGLETLAPFSVTEDRDGRIWFVGFGGAWRYDGSAIVNVTRDGPW